MNRASKEHRWTFFREWRGSDSTDSFDYCDTCGVIRARHVWKGGQNDPTYYGPGVEMGTTNQPVCLALIAPAPPAPEAVALHLSQEDAAIIASALGISEWECAIDEQDSQRLQRVIGAALDAALARGAAADAGEDGCE